MENSEKIMRCLVTLAGLPVRADQFGTVGKPIMDVVQVLQEVYVAEKEKEQNDAGKDKGENAGG